MALPAAARTPGGERPQAGGGPRRGVLPSRTTACGRRPPASAALRLPGAAERQRSGSSRQGCASDEVEVPIPSIARFSRVAYRGHGEVTTHERLGWKSHGCHTVYAVAVGAIWVASTPAGLNMRE